MLSAFVLASALAAPGAPPAAAPSLAFTNGLWFDGQSFQRRTVYAAEGRLTFRKPRRVDRTVDLRGWHVIPPFAEAHNHNLITRTLVEAMGPQYLREGVFYAKMQSSLPAYMPEVAPRLNRPDSVDAVFAHGPLTATGGHPVALREMLLERGMYPGYTKETLDNQGYVIVDDRSDLERKWPIVLGFRPDFIKTVLVHSEEFGKRKDDAAYFGRKGLDPRLLPDIVTKAHGAGLRVSVHVATAVDFHHAVASGADEIAHLPGMGGPESIAPEDAKLAAKKGVVVVTTASLALRRKDRADLYERIRAAQAANLRLLHSSGVTLAVGSDDVEQASLGEVRYLRELGALDDRALLEMWTANAARTIFPRRKVGALREGYEASFLALEGNPLQDFEAVTRIRLRVKQGLLLAPPEPAR